MKSRNRYHGILSYAVEAVRHWALRLTRHPAFGPSDLEDLEQELMLDLHRRIERYDSDKAGLHTFISRIMAHCAATLIEKATSFRRGGGQEVISLNTTIARHHDGHPIELADAIASDQSLWVDSGADMDDLEHLRIDAGRVLMGLPGSLKRLAGRLFGETVTEISRATGTPRSTIYDAIDRIRAAFIRVGYDGSDIRQPRTSTPFVLRFAL